MAKKIVKVNEEKIRGYMVGDIPDAIENEDIIVVEVPEEENNERQDTEKKTARKNPKPCNMPECDSNFRQKYLVNTSMPGRIQAVSYTHLDVYKRQHPDYGIDRIKHT